MKNQKISREEYKAMTIRQRIAYKRNGGQVAHSFLDKVGMIAAVLSLCLVGAIISASEKPQQTPQKIASVRCLAEVATQVKGADIDYSTLQYFILKPRIQIGFNFTYLNQFNKEMVGRAYCETDMTGQALLLVEVG